MANLKNYSKKLLSPVFVVLVICLVFLVASLFLTFHIRSYNSDDITWQNILLTWKPFSGHQVVLGSSDNMIDKVPFLWLMGKIFPAGRKLAFLEAVILQALSFTFFYVSSIYFLKKLKVRLSYITLLPFVWFASFGYSFAELLLSPIWRGFDIGASFLFFMLAAMLFYNEFKPLKSVWHGLIGLIAVGAAGVFIFSDPYFLYFTIAPILLFAIVLALIKKINRSHLLTVFGFVLLSLVASKVTHLIFTAADIKMVTTYPATFVDFNHLFSNIAITIHGLLIIFGADFFGQNIVSLLAVGAFINAILVGFIAYKTYQSLRGGFKQKVKDLTLPQLWMIFFGTLSFLVIVAYVVSNLADISTYRYFIMTVLASVLFLSMTLGLLKSGRRPLAALIVLAIILNFAVMLNGMSGFLQPGSTDGNRRNNENYALIDTAEAAGLTKGYANYWQGAINTYLSQNRVDFLPATCSTTGQTTKFHWLISEDQFNTSANKSFILIDPDIATPASCTPKQVINQFGQPQKILKVNDKSFYIYNYDVSTRMM